MDAGRERELEDVVGQVVDPVRRYLSRRTDRGTADEVTSEVLVVCWQRLHQIPPDVVPWAIGTARNCLRNHERSQRRRTDLVSRIIAVDPPEDAGPQEPDASDRAERLRAAMARLRPGDAEVLRLWAWEQLGPAEIALVLDVSVNAATLRLHRARRRLRQHLDTPAGPPPSPAPVAAPARRSTHSSKDGGPR